MSLPTLDNNENLPKFSMPSLLDDFDDLEKDEQELDNEFNSIEHDNLEEDDKEYNDEIYQEIEEDEDYELPYSEQTNYQTEDDYNPDYDEDLRKEKAQLFINKKNKKIIPYGGNKSKRKVRSSELDHRKNALAQTKIIRFFILMAMIILFLIGLKNTFFPNHVYTSNQIKQFAKDSVGKKDFPLQRGESFVKDFMTVYLTIDKQRPELKQIMTHFYGENTLSDLSNEKLNLSTGINAKQHIIIGPSIYESESLTDYSAIYKVSAYVSNTDNTAVDGNHTNGRWLTFSVNVYYDKEIDKLAITPDSPSLIPTPQNAKQTIVPERLLLGNGIVNTDIGPALNPTINGFIEAYAKASLEHHDSILQYIYDKSDITLYNGFGGAVELKGSPNQAIKKIIYNGDDEFYRVDITVNWIDKIALDGDNRLEYTSRYIMLIVGDGKGKYSVSKFIPYTYFK